MALNSHPVMQKLLYIHLPNSFTRSTLLNVLHSCLMQLKNYWKMNEYDDYQNKNMYIVDMNRKR